MSDMGRAGQQVHWRLPPQLYERLKAYAARTRRSVPAAAAVLLEAALAAEEQPAEREG